MINLFRMDPISPPAPSQRYRMLLEYDGGAFHGWQRQAEEPTVQAALEQALARLSGAPVTVVGAGRTDAGVHASGQVAHFDLPRSRPAHVVQKALNALTPPGLSVREVRATHPDFHARFHAVYREYGYRLLDREAPPALERARVWHQRRRLNTKAMQEGLALLLGTHDFSAFRAASCQAKQPVRSLLKAEVIRVGEEIHILLGANAFLHHMVRNMVGALVPVGRGERPAAWMGELLAGRDRTRGAPTAPPQGLTLLRVIYPGEDPPPP